jgi:hypothetical membrane protein
MQQPSISARCRSTSAVLAARLAIVTACGVVGLLASLHVLSPEFDPAVRVLSEYATGGHGWVLSLLFVCWAASSWSLLLATWPALATRAGRLGLVLLGLTGLGQAMAAVFDITHPLHHLAGALGVLGLPAAALLMSGRLAQLPPWSDRRPLLLVTAHLTWLSRLLFVVAMLVMVVGYTRAGGRLTPEVVALAGYANRLRVVLDCAWVVAVAWPLSARRRWALAAASPSPRAQRQGVQV